VCRFWSVKSDVEKAGLTPLGFSLGIRRLVKKEFIEIAEEPDHKDEIRSVIRLREKGWQWIETNEHLFKVHKHQRPSFDAGTPDVFEGAGISDDDVPF
jgi:hypothetical protein